MIRALYSAATGMLAQQTNMDTVSNNLANINTAGYKKTRAEFQDLLYSQLPAPARGETAGISVGHGVRLSSIHRIFSGGGLQATGNELDVAIQGNGLFRVQQADGSIAYTRDGSFHLDDQRRLVTSAGDLVLSSTGPITVPFEAGDLEVTSDGTIRYTDPALLAKPGESANAMVKLDQLSMAVFANPAGLEATGDNLWRETAASGVAQTVNPGDKEAGRLVQRYLEASNVQAVEEMVSLIMAQRAYEMNSKVVQSADEMMSLANNLRRG